MPVKAPRVLAKEDSLNKVIASADGGPPHLRGARATE